MEKRVVVLLIAVLLIVIAIYQKNQNLLTIGIRKGERAPDFKVTDIQGDTLELS